MQRLGTAAHRRKPLERHAHDVDLGLLSLKRYPAGLGVKANSLRKLVGGPESVSHDLRPHPPHRAELGDLLKDVVVAVEEERQAGAELIDLQPGVQRCLDVGDRVRERERDLLDCRAALLADVVPGDRDRVPAGDVLLAVGKDVGRQPHRRLGWVDVVAAGDVLL